MPEIEAIRQCIQGFIERGEISGAVSVVSRENRIEHFVCTGVADLHRQSPMTPTTVFWIASMTKPIVATALMQLVEAGDLTTEDRVSRYLPAFADVQLSSGAKPTEPIRIRHLLSHTSGLRRGEIPPPPDTRSLEQIAGDLASRPLEFAPGSRWEYSASMHVVGRLIEVVASMPFDEYLKQHILGPLGMHDTTFNLSVEQRKRMATLYARSSSGQLVPAEFQYVTPDPSQPQHPSPSGGLFSTGADCIKFFQAIAAGGTSGETRVVSQQSIDRMTSVATKKLKTGWTPGNGWGLGWCVVREPQGVTGMLSSGSYGHGGVYGTQVWIDRAVGRVMMLLIHRSDLGNADASDIRKEFQQSVCDGLGELGT